MRATILFGLISACTISAVIAQTSDSTGAKRVNRPLSLKDCVKMALERNLSIQIGDRVSLGDTADLDIRSGGRLGMEQSRLAYDEATGIYDPQFQASVGQRFNNTPGSIDPVIGTVIRSEIWNEDFSAGFDGVLPWGTRYELSSSLNRLSGERGPIIVGGFPITQDIPFQYTSVAYISVTQPLLRDFWIDGQRLTIKLNRKEIKMSELSFQLLVMDVVQRVSLAYYDLVAARDLIEARRKALELAETQVAENRKKVDVGAMAPLDVRQAEAQAATAKADLTQATFDAQRAENIVKSLISHEFTTIHKINVQPTDKLVAVYQAFTLAESWRSGLESRPDYLLAKEQVEAQDIVLKYRHNQLFPALDLVGTYGRNGLGNTTLDSLDTIADNRFPFYGGTIVLRFPLTFRAERSAHKRAKLQKEHAILSLKQIEDNVLTGIDNALKSKASTYSRTESTREARRYAEEALLAEQGKFAEGRSTSFQVLQLQEDLTQARSNEIQALADYNKALHELYFNEGTTLQRMDIHLELK
jgi:outer membrane protein TolC